MWLINVETIAHTASLSSGDISCLTFHSIVVDSKYASQTSSELPNQLLRPNLATTWSADVRAIGHYDHQAKQPISDAIILVGLYGAASCW